MAIKFTMYVVYIHIHTHINLFQDVIWSADGKTFKLNRIFNQLNEFSLL